MLSHDDIDHTGGALSVVQAVPIAAMLTSLPDLDPLLLIGPEERRCVAGQAWQWDGVIFEMLYPDRASRESAALKDNERSCVLKITAAAGSVLIPADIERHGERTLLATASEHLRADVLIAPHQGSRTSSSDVFVRAVAPRTVIFPVGYRNAFRHPHPDVVERYRQLGSAMHFTDRHGAVLLQFGAGSITFARQRESGDDTGWIRQGLLQVPMNFQPFGEAKRNDVNELPVAPGNGPWNVGCTVKSR